MDNSYGLLEVQEANLIILKEIDRICQKYNINYILDAGTLLGAIRHGGFIPWDDDADIAMTRSSYEAFKRVAKRELGEGMSLLMPDELRGGKAFYDFTPRVIYDASRRRKPDKETAFYEEKLNKLWVDIFIIDNIPDTKCLSSLMRLIQKSIYLFSMGHRYKTDYKKYKLSHKLMVLVFSNIGKLIPMRTLFKLQNFFAKLFGKKRAKKVFYSNYQPDYIDIILEREWVLNTGRIKFEDIELSIPDYYDEILKTVYGDYMKLPKKENRKASHGSKGIEIYG